MKRIRETATIDRDSVSPDSIRAAQEYLLASLERRAEALMLAMDWNTWRTVSRRRANGDLHIIQYVKAL